VTVSQCEIACVCGSLLISVFAKWSKWEPTGSCALHFLPSSSSLPALPFSSSPEPRCAYVLGCFNFSAHNWAEPQGAFIHWDNNSKHEFTLSIFLPGWVSCSCSLSPSKIHRHKLKAQYGMLIKQIKLQTKMRKNGAFL